MTTSILQIALIWSILIQIMLDTTYRTTRTSCTSSSCVAVKRTWTLHDTDGFGLLLIDERLLARHLTAMRSER